MPIIIKAGICMMNIIYGLLSLAPVKQKVTFISRQSDHPSIDIKMMCDGINKIQPNCSVVVLCKTLPPGMGKKLIYGLHMFRQMYHMATSQVVVLDSYCIAVSVLKHKKELTVIQMWHALGCLKKFGYSILDQEEGRSSRIAELMKMHENYDYIFASSAACKAPLSDAYRCDQEKIIVMSLPRVDLLCNQGIKERVCKRIKEEYTALESNKKTILYAPTFRKNQEEKNAIDKLVKLIDLSKYNVILKEHPLMHLDNLVYNIIVDKKFSVDELISVSDYVITDYSAVVFEAAVADKPLFFYSHDLNSYENRRNFYIDYKSEMPGVISDDPKIIVQAIENEAYDLDRIQQFSDKYIENKYNCTEKAIAFILRLMRKEEKDENTN